MAAYTYRKFGLLILLGFMLAGCGSNASPDLSAVSTLEPSRDCIRCHESSAVSSVTGESITEAWQLSAHNTASSANSTGNGASCGDCHEPEAGHPNSCATCHGGATPASGPLVQHNPDTALKCGKCHTRQAMNDPAVGQAHFSDYTAAYVSTRFKGKCRSCHNPHNPSGHFAKNEQWAESGHGDHLATPWSRDFKTMGTVQPVATTFQSICVRCHTATGYINYVTSGLTDQSAWGAAEFAAGDRSKQVLACPACHDDGNGNSYSFTVRQVSFNGGGIRVYYNYSSPTRNAGSPAVYPTIKVNNQPEIFEDVGMSNLCMVCHVGRLVGRVIKETADLGLNFSKISRMGAHDFSGGATVFQKSAYEYAGRDYTKAPYFQHELIGRANFKGTGTKGPCIACHMNSELSHSYSPVTKNADGTINRLISRTCGNCHTGQYLWTDAALEAEKSGFLSAMAAFYELQIQKGTATKRPNPPSASISYTTNWELLYGSGTGPNTMGSAFNFDLFKNDPGAFAHNSLYTRRIIYDSLDWLHDGALNDSVETAISGLPASTDFIKLPPIYQSSYQALAIDYLLGGAGGSRPAPH